MINSARACPLLFIGAMTEGPKIEAELSNAESGVGFLGSGQQASPPHQLGCLGERCELPSGVRGGAPTAHRFPIFSALRMASHDTIG